MGQIKGEMPKVKTCRKIVKKVAQESGSGKGRKKVDKRGHTHVITLRKKDGLKVPG